MTYGFERVHFRNFLRLINSNNEVISVDGKLIKRNIRGWQKIIGYVPQKTL